MEAPSAQVWWWVAARRLVGRPWRGQQREEQQDPSQSGGGARKKEGWEEQAAVLSQMSTSQGWLLVVLRCCTSCEMTSCGNGAGERVKGSRKDEGRFEATLAPLDSVCMGQNGSDTLPTSSWGFPAPDSARNDAGRQEKRRRRFASDEDGNSVRRERREL